MLSSDQRTSEHSRRGVLRRGAKLAYVAPAVIAAMKVESAFAASGGSRRGSPSGAPSAPSGGRGRGRRDD